MPQPTDTVYINYFDSIDDKKVRGLMGICADIISKAKPKTLYFLLSSSGGLVDAGITLYNYLRALPIEIVMHNTGSIDSIANVVFLAAERRLASKHSSFLFHGIVQPINQGVALNKNQLNEVLSGLGKSEDKIQGILTERTKLTIEEVRNLFVQGESKDLAFAIDKGVIHEIRDPAIPPDAPIITVNIN